MSLLPMKQILPMPAARPCRHLALRAVELMQTFGGDVVSASEALPEGSDMFFHNLRQVLQLG